MKKLFTNIKTLINANKVAAIVTASAIVLAGAAAGIGLAVRNAREDDQADTSNTNGTAITTEAESTEDTADTADITGTEPDETAEPTGTEEETISTDSTAEPTEVETAEPQTETPKTEEPAVTTTAAPVTQAPVTEAPHVSVTGLTLDKYSVTLTVGQSDMPWVTMTPSNATDKSEVWTSSNTSVATVNWYGNITAVSAGTCTVTVRSADNSQAYAEVAVTVKAPETTPAATQAPATTPAAQTEAPAETTWTAPSEYASYGSIYDVPGVEDADPDVIAQIHANSVNLTDEQKQIINFCCYCGEENDMYHLHYNADVICYICGQPANANECHDCYD